MYAWGGLATINLLRTKYHSPRINTSSFLHLYDRDTVVKAIKVFDCSDIWMSYSWGFSDKTEQKDRDFAISKIKDLHELGLRVHLYVQGLNVVSREFKTSEFACVDPNGRELPYSKGRRLICPNNPRVRKLLVDRVTNASNTSADGVYVDNILFGFPPAFIRRDYAPFFGCSCDYCKKTFYTQFGYALKFPIVSEENLHDYVNFRAQTLHDLIAELSWIAHMHHKFFGINLYDPIQMNSVFYFGYKLPKIEEYLDYLLIENHSLPSHGNTNAHLTTLVHESKKPVFVVSYDRGIGFEPEYSQADIDSIASESKIIGYKPCYKVSEFTTNGIWHTLDFSKLHKVNHDIKIKVADSHGQYELKSHRWYDAIISKIFGHIGIPIVSLYFENQIIYSIGSALYRRGIHAWKNFEFDD